MIWPFNGTSWRGEDGEDQMTDEDWAKRGGEQARAMLNGLDPFYSSPDEDGDPTGGCYNGDYPQSWHDKLNQQLLDDEYYEAETEQQLKQLKRMEDER